MVHLSYGLSGLRVNWTKRKVRLAMHGKISKIKVIQVVREGKR